MTTFRKGDFVRHNTVGNVEAVCGTPGMGVYERRNFIDSELGFTYKDKLEEGTGASWCWDYQGNWHVVDMKKAVIAKLQE